MNIVINIYTQLGLVLRMIFMDRFGNSDYNVLTVLLLFADHVTLD
jgi:hypothetical protein